MSQKWPIFPTVHVTSDNELAFLAIIRMICEESRSYDLPDTCPFGGTFCKCQTLDKCKGCRRASLTPTPFHRVKIVQCLELQRHLGTSHKSPWCWSPTPSTCRLTWQSQ